MGRYPKGKSGNPKGRPAGRPNKLSRAAKENFEMAFEGSGGLPALVVWIKRSSSNRKEFYRLYSKLLPSDIKREEEEPQSFNVVIGNMTVSRARAELNEYFVSFANTKEGAAILEQRTKDKKVIEIKGRPPEKLPAHQHSEIIAPVEIKQPEIPEEKSKGN